MKITLAEKGGIGGVRLPVRTVESGNLTDGDRRKLIDLLSAARAATPATEVRSNDAMSYSVTVEDSGEPVTLRQSDAEMTPEFGALLNWIKQRI